MNTEAEGLEFAFHGDIRSPLFYMTWAQNQARRTQ